MSAPHTDIDNFDTVITQPDDTDLILPAAATLNAATSALANRTEWLKNRTGAMRVLNVFTTPFGTGDFGTHWVSASPFTVSAPGTFATFKNQLLGLPISVGASDVLLVDFQATCIFSALSTSGPSGVMFELQQTVDSVSYTDLTTTRVLFPVPTGTVAGTTVPVNLMATVPGVLTSLFNLGIGASFDGGTSGNIQFAGPAILRVQQLTQNPA